MVVFYRAMLVSSFFILSACTTFVAKMSYNEITHETTCQVVAMAVGQSSVEVNWPSPNNSPTIAIGLVAANDTKPAEPIHCIHGNGGVGSPSFWNVIGGLIAAGFAWL